MSGTSEHERPVTTIEPPLVRFDHVTSVLIRATSGSVVDLSARKYPSSTFMVIRSGLLIPSTGQLTVYTEPSVDLRFQVVDLSLPNAPSSTAASDGLVTVQKQVTLTATRSGTRRYTFSGSIRPVTPGTVSLYRNGALSRSGIPVSSSGRYSYTATFSGTGTFTFRTRSPATGYNAGSASPPRTVALY